MKSFTIEFLVTPEEKKLMQSILERYYGAIVKEEHIDKILLTNTMYRGEVVKYGVTSDTMARETLIDALIESVLGMKMPWPVNGSSQEYKDKFYRTYVEKCKLHGIDLKLD